MKKILKKVVLGMGIIFLPIIIFFLGYMIKAKSEIKNMNSTETKKIVGNIFAIQDSFVNLFLIKDSNQYIAIDGGNNKEIVSRELKKLDIHPDKIIAVFLTHTDGDHVAALNLFKNAKIYLSVKEEQLINGKKYRFLFFRNKIDSKEYSLIEDQQILTLGNIKIKGFLTPGHTPGSMCYLINNQYLFSGDALSLKAGKIDEFNSFFNMDTRTARQSLEKITQIPECAYIFSAHHGYTDDYKQAVKDWNK